MLCSWQQDNKGQLHSPDGLTTSIWNPIPNLLLNFESLSKFLMEKEGILEGGGLYFYFTVCGLPILLADIWKVCRKSPC